MKKPVAKSNNNENATQNKSVNGKNTKIVQGESVNGKNAKSNNKTVKKGIKKPALLTAAVLAVVITVGCIVAFVGQNKDSANSIPALQINDIKSDPQSFTGEIAITGINVGTYEPDPTIFFLMDTAELIACKNMQCGAYQLPAIYKGSGPMPELADDVTITGSWGEYEMAGETGLTKVPIFEVTKIEVKRNVMSILNS